MTYKPIIDTKNLVPPKNKETIFFGEYSGFQRYDNPKYKFAVNMEERQRNAFWNPSEISMNSDSQKFWDLPEHIQEIMINVWLFQTLMDSGQNKGLEEVMAELCTNPEFEALFKTWGYFELIHSLSYSHILRGIFADSSKIFDKIAEYPEIQSRIDSEIELYSKIKDIEQLETLEEKKKLVLELLVSIYALEGVKFYVSFLVTYIINNSYNNAIAGSTRIIKLINFDEDLHTGMSAGLLDILRKEKSEGFSELMDSDWYRDMVKERFQKVYDQEMDWGRYLLSIGQIPSLTENVTSTFLKYYIDNRVQKIGVDKIYNQEKTDVVQWFMSYKNLNLDNAALQESDLAVYSIGIMKDDIPEGRIDEFDDIEEFRKLFESDDDL
ncbi:ribonucleoside diphosphate reductase small subunit [Vibrio phage VB_VaC_TDDLMA]